MANVLRWVKERGVTLTVDPNNVPQGMSSTTWGEPAAPVQYQDGKAPFLVEINRNTGPDSLSAQEINEFIQELEGVKKSRKRDQVIQHLRQTQFIVACQIPTQDFGDTGFHALDAFMAYFLVHCGGMVQADGQGFYDMGKLILEMAA